MRLTILAGLIVVGLVNFAYPVNTANVAVTILSPKYESVTVYQQAWRRVSVPFHRLQRPLGLISNHHLLAADLMAETFSAASSALIRRIIIISPDHFLNGRQPISTTAANWDTPIGIVKADKAAVVELTKYYGVGNEPTALTQEHGIFNLLPMVKRYFPQATIIPIALKYEVSEKRLSLLEDYLKKHADFQTLIIGSFDFAHGQTAAESDRLDTESLRAIETFSAIPIASAQVDSPLGLMTLIKTMKNRGAAFFQGVGHDNSARITGNLNANNTTSYITGVFR